MVLIDSINLIITQVYINTESVLFLCCLFQFFKSLEWIFCGMQSHVILSESYDLAYFGGTYILYV